jgi:hypothetical protein
MTRPGPKFEVTWDMAVQNLIVVAARLQTRSLSSRQYEAEGSFSVRALERKWPWHILCAGAGLTTGTRGRPVRPRRACMEACGRLSKTTGPLCRTCARRNVRRSRGVLS